MNDATNGLLANPKMQNKNSLKLFLLFLVVGLCAASAQARIGWTKAQCDAFYASATDKQETGPSPYGDMFFFKVADVFVRIEFIDNRAIGIHYSRPGQPFLPAEVYALLEKNGTSITEVSGPTEEEKLQLGWMKSPSSRWNTLIARKDKLVIIMLADTADAWQNTIDWIPTVGVSLLDLVTYDGFKIRKARSDAMAEKAAIEKAAAAKSTNGL